MAFYAAAYLRLKVILGPGEPQQPLYVCNIAGGCSLKKFHSLTLVTGQTDLAVDVLTQFQTEHNIRGVAGLSQSLHALYESHNGRAGHGDSLRLGSCYKGSALEVQRSTDYTAIQCRVVRRGRQEDACLARCLHPAPALPPNERFEEQILQGGVQHTWKASRDKKVKAFTLPSMLCIFNISQAATVIFSRSLYGVPRQRPQLPHRPSLYACMRRLHVCKCPAPF